MEIKDGGFAIKAKKLREGLSSVRADVCDSGLAAAINGVKDIVEAEELIAEMQQLQILMDGQIKMLREKINDKKKTFVVREK